MRLSTKATHVIVVTCIVVALLGLGRGSANADDAPPVQFDYLALPGCPGVDAFIREVLARAPQVRLATSPDHARTLVARVHQRGGGIEGTLVVRDADGATTERTVRARSCAELVTALAVISALVLDPVASRDSDSDRDASVAFLARRRTVIRVHPPRRCNCGAA